MSVRECTHTLCASVSSAMLASIKLSLLGYLLTWVESWQPMSIPTPILRPSDPTPTAIKGQVARLSLLLAASFLPPLFRVFHSQQCAGASWSRMGVTRGCKSCGDWRLVTIQRETCKWIKTQTQTQNQNQIIFCKTLRKSERKARNNGSLAKVASTESRL